MAMVDLLGRIYKAELISPQSRNYLLDVMAQCATGKNRIKALLPMGTQVEHKTGTLNGLPATLDSSVFPTGAGRRGDLHPRRCRPSTHHRRDGACDLRRLPHGLHLAVRPALTAQ